MDIFLAWLFVLMSLGSIANAEEVFLKSERGMTLIALVFSLVLLFVSTFWGVKIDGGWAIAYLILVVIALLANLIIFGKLLVSVLQQINFKGIAIRLASSAVLSSITSFIAISLGFTEVFTLLQFSMGGILFFSISLFGV